MTHVRGAQYPKDMDQVRSCQRVIDYGEAFAPRWMVDAMLDLVKHESERIDSHEGLRKFGPSDILLAKEQ